MRTNNKGINSPGVRNNSDGSVVVQMAKRSKQLDGIASEIKAALTPPDGVDPKAFVTIGPKLAHKLRRYCEQLGIIADELKSVGK
jgi:hypothetical protein